MFFTATILEWKKLLKPSKYKDIIIESMRFMVKAKRVKIYSFAIMDNHIHIIWQIKSGYTKNKIQVSFLKYIAQQIKFDLVQNHPEVLEKFFSLCWCYHQQTTNKINSVFKLCPYITPCFLLLPYSNGKNFSSQVNTKTL